MNEFKNIHVYGQPSRFMYEGNYHSSAVIIPNREVIIEYLKEEIKRLSSINSSKNMSIGVGIIYDSSISRLAEEASKRKELSDNLNNREVEIELRVYFKRFQNIEFISINTGPCHICKRPVWVMGAFIKNARVSFPRFL